MEIRSKNDINDNDMRIYQTQEDKSIHANIHEAIDKGIELEALGYNVVIVIDEDINKCIATTVINKRKDNCTIF